MTENQKEILVIVLAFLFIFGGMMFITRCAYPQEINLDKWADSIYIAEGKEKAVVPYGMFFKGCDWDNVDYCRKIVKNTIYNTLFKYRKSRCKPEWGDVTCLANRYCPINSDTDDGTCKFWKGNVLANLPKEMR